MLIVGAKGFAKEILEILHQNENTDNLVFYDDVNEKVPEQLFGRFPILKNLKDAEDYLASTDNNFTIGIGNPTLRFNLYEKFKKIGGEFFSTISNQSTIGSFDVTIGRGNNILSGVQISNSVTIGIGNIIYYNSIITHDVLIGNFCEISPAATLLGRAHLGDNVRVGSGAIILPNISIGDNAIIAAGAVVTQDVPANTMVAGIPAVIKKTF